jgi:GNAT superfamily N-acetyltransferase
MPNDCSVTKKLQIVPGMLDDYRQLAHYHYRDSSLGPVAGVFILKPASPLPGLSRRNTVGVIVYTMPTACLELRSAATGNFLAGLDRSTQLAVINKNIRRISRVIIEPRFRGLGLATRLVRETMPRINVLIIEAMAVMGMVNPFFEKAGMKPYAAALPQRCVMLIEAFSAAGIEENQLFDAEFVQQKLDALRWPAADFIEDRIRKFLQSYGKRRNMPPCLERTRYILSKLTERPIYYIWFNPAISPHACPERSRRIYRGG